MSAPPGVSAPSVEPSPEDVAAWEAIERRASGAPHIISRELHLRPPPTEEELEAEAICAEGCGGLP